MAVAGLGADDCVEVLPAAFVGSAEADSSTDAVNDADGVLLGDTDGVKLP